MQWEVQASALHRLFSVTPRKAGSILNGMDSRLRGNDGGPANLP